MPVGRCTVSVVVPARDEAATLDRLLGALARQTRRPDEIVVVDAGSTDATRAVAQRHVADGVRVHDAGPSYPGRARNKGIEAAAHDWIALTDGGCVPDERWLESLMSAAAGAPDARVVFGQWIPTRRDEWDVAQTLVTVAPSDARTGCRPPSACSMLIHREAWRAAGGFPDDLRAAEDLRFFARLAAEGVRAIHAPAAVVRWEPGPGLLGTFRKLRIYSRYQLAAGLAATWHVRVIVMDLAAIGLGAIAPFWPPALLPLLAGGLARLLSTIARRRAAVRGPFRPDRLLRAAVVLALADLAVWIGLLDELGARARRR